ncbi:hypothetical protein SAMN05421819_1481 [Bryocella elongata]|uniref:Outer membrane protein beta-barrel domain-containing protein n=1 Tax=Bryocella elongata TaxID=863522 RepID=A0A1H5W8W1_9BACT|nr:hypothetical protein [Bryocella elongata]SEF95808.1 hypothetical protein SAMN05421819_1481 [Bryocella elongata]
MFARKSLSNTARLTVVSLAALLIPSLAATAQSSTTPKGHVARHETNASRQARIQRTIEDTYTHRWEVFGGGGWLRYRSGQSLQRNNEVTWAVSTNYFLNPKLFVVGAASGAFGNAKVPNNIYGVYNPQINEYFFQGGAGYRVYAKEKVAVSVQGVGGVADGIFSGGAKGLYGYQLGLWQDGVRPAFSVSGNVDYNFQPNLAFRFTPVYQATLFSNAPGTSSSSSIQSHFGFNAGVLYRFGHQK